jgi:hypothetical protein
VGLLKDVVVTAFLPMLGNTLILIGMVVPMLWLPLKLTLLALATISLFSLTTLRRRRIKKVSRQQDGAIAAATADRLVYVDDVCGSADSEALVGHALLLLNAVAFAHHPAAAKEASQAGFA